MIRGTTPTILFKTDIKDTEKEIKECEIVIRSEKVTIVKSKTEMKFTNNCIMCDLSIEDTMSFKQNGSGETRVPKPEPVFIQLKVTLNNGTVCASKVFKSTINAILQEE